MVHMIKESKVKIPDRKSLERHHLALIIESTEESYETDMVSLKPEEQAMLTYEGTTIHRKYLTIKVEN